MLSLRTFITDDSSRDDLVAHVYDVTYGVVKPTDNLVIIDDSIVRGTTLKKSILRMLDRLTTQTNSGCVFCPSNTLSRLLWN